MTSRLVAGLGLSAGRRSTLASGKLQGAIPWGGDMWTLRLRPGCARAGH